MQFESLLVEDIAAPEKNAIVGGPFGSNLVSRDYVESGVPVIRGQNMSDRWVSGEFVFVSPAKAERLAPNKARPGDLIFTQRGTLGQVAMVPEAPYEEYIVSQSQMKLTPDRQKADLHYLYYLFRSEEQQDYIRNVATQTGVPHTNLATLRTTPIKLPSLADQQHISSVLRLLDSRITLLRETNATLEAIAQALFKSWFVDFDPVHAKMEGRAPEGMDEATAALFSQALEESTLGLIPAGWSVGSLGDICTNPRLQANPARIPSDTPYIGLEHMPRKSIALDSAGTSEGLESGKFWFERDDVLFGKLRPYFHKVGLAAGEGVCSTDILVIRATEPKWLGYVAMHLSSDSLIAYATLLSNGARMPRSSWKDLAGFRVTLPPLEVVRSFSDLARPMLNRIYANIKSASVLSELRDTLLPRLISGKLRLPESQELVSEALA